MFLGHAKGTDTVRAYNKWPLSRVKVREDLSEKGTFKQRQE